MATDNFFHNEHDERGDVIQSKAARAGKRTYFFDVKETQGGDYYLVITESRRRFNEDGSANYTRNHIYLYKEDFDQLPENVTPADAAAILEAYTNVYDKNDDQSEWFGKVKSLCEPLGYTPNVKEWKQDPTAFKGHVGHLSTVIRVAITSRTNTPDLCAIMQILGKEECVHRLQKAANYYKG